MIVLKSTGETVRLVVSRGLVDIVVQEEEPAQEQNEEESPPSSVHGESMKSRCSQEYSYTY